MPFTLAWKQGHLKNNPLVDLPPMKGNAGEKGVFAPAEIARLVDKAPLDWKGRSWQAITPGPTPGRLHPALKQH